MDLYVNSDSTAAVDELNFGDDLNNDGATPLTPKLTITSAIESNIFGPLTEDVNIYLARSEPIYDEINESLDLGNKIKGPYAINIQPYAWTLNDELEGEYEDAMDPMSENYDPDSLTFPKIPSLGFIMGSTVLGLSGVQVCGDVGSGSGPATIFASQGTTLQMKCCKVTDSSNALWLVNAFSMMQYCHFEDNDIAIQLMGAANLLMIGSCSILNSGGVGLSVGAHSTLAIVSPDSSEATTLVIKTTEARAEYTAVKLLGHGLISCDFEYHSAMPKMPGYIRILKENVYDHSKYIGVSVESLSCLLGAKNVQFKDPSDTDAVDCIPESRQIVVATEQGAVAVE